MKYLSIFNFIFVIFLNFLYSNDVQLELHHPNIEEAKVFAKSPDIMTPIGVAVAPDGRVFIQENHTHKRKKDYRGPSTDRILIFEDTDGDGVHDKRSTFYEGLVHSTDLLFGPDGHLYVSTRWFIARFKNASQQPKAQTEPEIIIRCKTDGDYPHNGVGGLTIDPAQPDWLAFGFGENSGIDYTFIGSDGVKISGGGEGGSTYRCKTDGSNLSKLSTGHWNAFGMCYDLKGNLFSTDNDPSSTPPNRLLHIIPGCDFGFEYRYGRSGRHPLVSWYGEIPGTLGMAGALGEAACGIIPYSANRLLSASWTDNRVDLHFIQKKGESFQVSRNKFISGPDHFRPVHFSYSHDGKYLYFTDWVSLSYPVHGEGRIWRVKFKQPINLKPLPREEPKSITIDEAIKNLANQDAYLRTQAINTLVSAPHKLKSFDWKKESNPVRVAHFAVAIKRQNANANAHFIPEFLQHDHPDVRFIAIKWIADEKLTQYKNLLEQQLKRKDLDQRLLQATVAALSYLDGTSKSEFSSNSTMLKLAKDESKPDTIRSMALQSIKADYVGLQTDDLKKLLESPSMSIKRQAVRTLSMRKLQTEAMLLAKIAKDKSISNDIRADAIAGLSAQTDQYITLFKTLLNDKEPIVAYEAKRNLALLGQVERNLEEKPDSKDLQAWMKMIDKAPGKENVLNGRRIFFHPKIGLCSSCHTIDGRGMEVGPDLTTIQKQGPQMKKWLLEHIIDPNAEVAPYFRPQIIHTKNGENFMGLILGKEGAKQGYVSNTGEKYYVLKSDILHRKELDISIMPPGLLYAMTASEIRDLIAYLIKGETKKT